MNDSLVVRLLFTVTASVVGLLGLTLAAAAPPIVGAYPVPGRAQGTTAFSQESRVDRQASSQYPAWFRGRRSDGLADEWSKYYFTQLVGPVMPKSDGDLGPNAQNIRMGTLVLKPGATYPAHNHPTREIYYVIEGEADWFVDDEKQHVVPGAIIMHRPYAVHGWTNTSKVKRLKVVWIRWLEGDETPPLFDLGARFVNPDMSKDEATAKPFAVPLPTPHSVVEP